MKLFWATTKEGYEDWFVIANSKEVAEEYHEDSEGFNTGDAKAKFVCNISEDLIQKYKLYGPDWPTIELLSDLGGLIISESNPRKVNFNGKMYVEGNFSEGMFFDDVGNVAGVYIIRIQNSQKYKIGKTINLRKRIKQFSTGNPENLKLDYFIETKHYQSLERHLHNIFKNDRIGGEWFLFDDKKLEELVSNLALLQSKGSEYFKIYNIKDVSIRGRVY